MQRIRASIRVPRGRGFTLVELMIAMALVSALTGIIYGLFVRTSDSLTDIEGLSGALDQARFGLEFVRNDLGAAGSHASPNAAEDIWVEPKDSNLIIHGIRGYDKWQNDRSVYTDGPDEVQDLDTPNPQSAFSGVVILGAYDFPTSFFLSFPNATEPGNQLVVESTERGMLRFLGYDPFDTRIVGPVQLSDETHLDGSDLNDFQGYLQSRAEARLLRVTDTQGFSQITPITTAEVGTFNQGAGGAGAGGEELRLTLGNLQFLDGDARAGFDRATEDDVSFDAAMIDAIWYYVAPAQDDPRNLQLIRQRIDAGSLVAGAEGLTQTQLEGMEVGVPMVIAEHVVDFRVWFDCAGASGDPMTVATWQDGWDVNTDDCIGPSANDSEPERARVGHIRLSTRTDSENSNRPHLRVTGQADWHGFRTIDGQMRTYDLVPTADGSASVVTVQTSVELANFAARDILR